LGMVEELAPHLHELERRGEKVLVADVNLAA
jgi:phage gp16-like protein